MGNQARDYLQFMAARINITCLTCLMFSLLCEVNMYHLGHLPSEDLGSWNNLGFSHIS